MREITQEPRFRTKILRERTVHIFSVGFEERCVAYPQAIRDANPRVGEQIFLCVNPPDDNVSWYLRSLRKENQKRIKELLPSTHIASLDEIIREIHEAQAPSNYCVDISTLPRHFIFSILSEVLRKREGKKPVYIVYTYPREYAYGDLEKPAPDVSFFFDAPRLQTRKKVAAVMLPGFDRECTDITLTYIKASTGCDPLLQWHFPFPGRIYAYYERALESHIDLTGTNSFFLYPQEEINLAFDRFKKDIDPLSDLPIYFVPLGPRITCVSILLASLWCQNQGIESNIIIPMMRKYTSVRSGGSQTPLIEEIIYSI